MKLIGPSPFNSHFFSQLALPNGRAGERNERVDGQWGPKRLINQWRMNWFNGAREVEWRELLSCPAWFGGLWAGGPANGSAKESWRAEREQRNPMKQAARRAFLPFLHQIKFMNWFDWKKREESEGWASSKRVEWWLVWFGEGSQQLRGWKTAARLWLPPPNKQTNPKKGSEINKTNLNELMKWINLGFVNGIKHELVLVDWTAGARSVSGPPKATSGISLNLKNENEKKWSSYGR